MKLQSLSALSASFPTVEVEYPPKAPGGPTVRKKYVIDGFC